MFAYMLNAQWMERELRNALTAEIGAYVSPSQRDSLRYNEIVRACRKFVREKDFIQFVIDLGLSQSLKQGGLVYAS